MYADSTRVENPWFRENVEAKLQAFQTSTLNGDEWLAPCHVVLSTGIHWIGG
jgi:hypothetical protein